MLPKPDLKQPVHQGTWHVLQHLQRAIATSEVIDDRKERDDIQDELESLYSYIWSTYVKGKGHEGHRAPDKKKDMKATERQIQSDSSIESNYPECDFCQTNKDVVCVIPYFEWCCTKCHAAWMGDA
jgi:hypothetical protein